MDKRYKELQIKNKKIN